MNISFEPIALPFLLQLKIKIGTIIKLIQYKLFYKRSISEFIRFFLVLTLPLLNIEYILFSFILLYDYLYILLNINTPVFKFDYEKYGFSTTITYNEETFDNIEYKLFYKNKLIMTIVDIRVPLDYYMPMIIDILETNNERKLNYISSKLNIV